MVDGGSTDETLEILRAYGELRWISEPDRGQSHALNKGFAMASGDLFGWLNADDSYERYAVAEAVAALQEPGAGLVYADVTRVNDDGVNPRRIRSRPSWDIWTELNDGNGIFSPSVFFTREAFETVGGLDESLDLTMDYDLWLRIGKRFGARHVDAVWSVQRVHAGAKTAQQDFWPERLSVSRRHGGRLVSPLLIKRYVRAGAPAAARATRRVGRVCPGREAAALMCGLCGIVSLGRPPEREAVEEMLDGLAHRGPDGRGLFADEGVCLGHLRLAIIDLSAAGLEPFAGDDGRLQLIFNGEIYNYLELRDELTAKGHVFRTATDTEVLLAGYREWGERCVEHFNGMWAFAIWDAVRRTLFCSRDRFGVKPFYYRLDGDRFAFASEPWVLGSRRPNLRAVRDYLEQGYLDQGDETFFADVVRLPPAHSLSFGPDGLHLHRYWRLEPSDPPADPAAAVRETFLDAVRLQLRSDVPVGTCLSGGIDSSAIAVAVAHHGHEQQKTVTAYFEDREYDERPYAQAVVDRTGAHAYWVTFTDFDLVENLPAIVAAQGEPFGSTSICAGWYVMREAKRAGLTVMLDGQGGDEVFAGYRGFFGYRLSDLLRHGHVAEAAAELRAFSGVNGPRWAAVALVNPHVPERVRLLARARLRGASSLATPDLRSLESSDGGNGTAFPDRLRRQLQLVLSRRGLPELLRYEDRNSMAHSLEARVPLLDHRLVELAFSLDGSELIRRGETKSVLRRALVDLLPPRVRHRRDKLGFVTPEARFLRGRLGELAADVFASQRLAGRGLVDAVAVRRRLERHRRGELKAGMELWRALNLELWAQRFLDA